MAIIKQVTGPRWVVIAWEYELRNGDTGLWKDQAVDADRSDIKGYWESMFSDETTIKYIKGEKPTRFRIKPLTPRQKDAAQGYEARALAIHRIRYGLVDVENLGHQQPDGTIEYLGKPKAKKSDLGGCIPMKFIHEMDLPEVFLLALGAMIHHLSEAQVPLANKSPQPPGPGGESSDEETEPK